MTKLELITNIPFNQNWTKEQCLEFMSNLNQETLRHLVSSQLYDENMSGEEYQDETLRIYQIEYRVL